MSGNRIVGTVSEEKLEQSDGFYRAYYIAHVPFCSAVSLLPGEVEFSYM